MDRDGNITVFLLDDHEVVRRGVHELLSNEPDIEVVGEAGTAADALIRIPATHPRVAILDVRLPDGSGVEVCREIRSRHEDIACLMLTSFSDDEALFDAIMAGASGYVLKAIRSAELLNAVRDVAAGKSLLDPEATRRVLERLRSGESRGDERLAGLTDQEKRILDLIAEGLTNRAIGERLHLAEKTVKNYVSSLLSKMGMERRSQAAAYVARKQAERADRPDRPDRDRDRDRRERERPEQERPLPETDPTEASPPDPEPEPRPEPRRESPDPSEGRPEPPEPPAPRPEAQPGTQPDSPPDSPPAPRPGSPSPNGDRPDGDRPAGPETGSAPETGPSPEPRSTPEAGPPQPPGQP